MNIKKEEDRAVKYIKIRVTDQFRENFKACCEACGTDMTKQIYKDMETFISRNMHKVSK